jgi:hypothetical protein
MASKKQQKERKKGELSSPSIETWQWHPRINKKKKNLKEGASSPCART